MTTIGIRASIAAWTSRPTLSEPVPYGMCFTSPCWLNRLSVNWVCRGATIHPGKASSMKLRTEAKASFEVSAPPVIAWTCAQSTMGRTKGYSLASTAMSPSVPKERSLPPGLQTEPDPELLDLGSHVLQPGTDPVDQLGSRPLMRVAEVGTNHWSTESPSQFHRVLQGGEALFCPVLLLDGEDREVGSMQREPYVPFRRQGPETGTTPAPSRGSR